MKFRRVFFGVWAVAAVVAAALLVVRLSSHDGRTTQQQPSPAASSIAAPVPSSANPSSSPSPTSVDDPVTENPLRVTKRSAFTDLVVEYEEAYRTADSPAKEARLAKLATPRYMSDHRPPANETIKGGDVVIHISPDMTKTILTVSQPGSNPNIRYVGVAPMESTTRTENGKEKVVMPWSLLDQTQPHATTWVLVNGAWEVDQER